jgi:hypothetical protein
MPAGPEILGFGKMDRELAATIRAELVRRCAGEAPVLGVGDQLAVFKCPSGAIGDVTVELERGGGVVVFVEGMTHGHFDEATHATPEAAVEACLSFLADLFDDAVVVWVVGGGRAGGWYYRDDGCPFPMQSRPPPGSRAGTWSTSIADVVYEVVFDGRLEADGGYAFVTSGDTYNTGVDSLFQGQKNGLLGAGKPGFLVMEVAKRGPLGLRVALSATEPPLDDAWEECVEVSFTPSAPQVRVVDAGAYGQGPGKIVSQLLLSTVSHRVRYQCNGMNSWYDRRTRRAADGKQTALLTLWPASAAPDRVIEATTDFARYCHLQVQEGDAARRALPRRWRVDHSLRRTTLGWFFKDHLRRAAPTGSDDSATQIHVTSRRSGESRVSSLGELDDRVLGFARGRGLTVELNSSSRGIYTVELPKGELLIQVTFESPSNFVADPDSSEDWIVTARDPVTSEELWQGRFSYWEWVDGSWGKDDADRELSENEWFERRDDQLVDFLKIALRSEARLAPIERKPLFRLFGWRWPAGEQTTLELLVDGEWMVWNETPPLFFDRPV